MYLWDGASIEFTCPAILTEIFSICLPYAQHDVSHLVYMYYGVEQRPALVELWGGSGRKTLYRAECRYVVRSGSEETMSGGYYNSPGIRRWIRGGIDKGGQKHI